jgi:hypothetical protein
MIDHALSAYMIRERRNRRRKDAIDQALAILSGDGAA